LAGLLAGTIGQAIGTTIKIQSDRTALRINIWWHLFTNGQLAWVMATVVMLYVSLGTEGTTAFVAGLALRDWLWVSLISLVGSTFIGVVMWLLTDDVRRTRDERWTAATFVAYEIVGLAMGMFQAYTWNLSILAGAAVGFVVPLLLVSISSSMWTSDQQMRMPRPRTLATTVERAATIAPPSDPDSAEIRGFTLLQSGRWIEARDSFTSMLSHPLEPLRRAGVLRNIMGTYAQEGSLESAIEYGNQSLQVLEAYRRGGCKPTELSELDELEENIRGHLQRLRGGAPYQMSSVHLVWQRCIGASFVLSIALVAVYSVYVRFARTGYESTAYKHLSRLGTGTALTLGQCDLTASEALGRTENIGKESSAIVASGGLVSARHRAGDAEFYLLVRDPGEADWHVLHNPKTDYDWLTKVWLTEVRASTRTVIILGATGSATSGRLNDGSRVQALPSDLNYCGARLVAVEPGTQPRGFWGDFIERNKRLVSRVRSLLGVEEGPRAR
jgi:hypothetical protein